MASDQPPVTIVENSANAHVIYDHTAEMWAASFFKGFNGFGFNEMDQKWIVKSVSRGCLIMYSEDTDGLVQFAISDPDLHETYNRGDNQFTGNLSYGRTPFYLSLHGYYEVTSEDGVEVSYELGGFTHITFPAYKGQTIQLQLKPFVPQESQVQ